MYGNGVKNVDIVYKAGKDNVHADALSCQPYLPAPDEGMTQGGCASVCYQHYPIGGG